ncbi:DMT family transporter [Roseomonas haemaphysalidis]|uniref:DMT family transporter n=1 Tax=Roseomonas haemaphysalidis TaxID=2768162 RepID=A0ABS3KM55_9PROT|nr:DMT family transporter [Roseomonas haemaphysalidis]MBO1078525.1 DMT family transporter [Roseomonas haemaphysalidis]
MDRSVAQGVLLSFLAYFAYALSDAAVKLLEGGIHPFQSAFFGGVFGLAAIPFVLRPGERLFHAFATTNRKLWLLRALMAVTGALGSITAFTHLSMAEAFCLLFLLPAFVTLLSLVFLKESIGWRRWAAVVVGFAGVLVVLRPGFRELNIGHLGAVVGGFSGAVTIVLMRALGGRERRISLYGAGLAGLIVVAGVLMLPEFRWPNAVQWLWLAGYGLLAAVANVLIIAASAKAPASLVAPPQYSQMIWAIILGYLVFHDRLDWPMAVGTALIVASGLLTLLREKKRVPVAAAAPAIHPQ